MRPLIKFIWVFLFLGISADVKYLHLKPSNLEDCKYENNETVCDLTTYNADVEAHIVDNENGTQSIIVIGAQKVILSESPFGYSEIYINYSKNIIARTSSNKSSKYRLTITHSNATSINESVRYFKSEHSKIGLLDLTNTEEYDIVSTEIGTFKAISSKRNPSIISSIINKMDIVCVDEGVLKISNTTVNILQSLTHSSTKDSIINSSSINKIFKDSIKLTDGTLTVYNTTLTSTEAGSFNIEKGNLIFDNMSSSIKPDLVFMKPEGHFKMRFYEQERTFVMSINIEKDNNNATQNSPFSPLSKIMIDDKRKFITLIVVGVLCLLLFIFITFLIFLLYRKYRSNGKKFPEGMLKLEVMPTNCRSTEREYVEDNDLNNESNILPNRNEDNNDLAGKVTSKNLQSNNSFEDYFEPEIKNEDEQQIYIEPDVKAPSNKHLLLHETDKEKQGNKFTDDQLEEYTEPELDEYSEPDKPTNQNLSANKPLDEMIYSEPNYRMGSVQKTQQQLLTSSANSNMFKLPSNNPKFLPPKAKPGVFPKPELIQKATSNPKVTFNQTPPNISFLSKNINNFDNTKAQNINPPKPALHPNYHYNNRSVSPNIPPKIYPEFSKNQQANSRLNHHPYLTTQMSIDEEEDIYEEYEGN